MENLYISQQQIYESIKKIAINIKKDSKERKTTDYFKRRLDNLEQYWAEYQYNHDRMCTEGSRTHVYFKNSEYEQTYDLYKSTKSLINQQYSEQQGPGTSSTSEVEEPEHDRGNSAQGRSFDIGHVKSTGSASKLDEMIKKQRSNFKAFNRAVANIDVSSLADKWEFDDALLSLQTRWSAIDALHWDIDSELNAEDEEYNLLFTTNEKIYIQLKKAINVKLWSSSHKEKTTPQLDIPEFNGNFNEWISFKDLFEEAIHNNRSLSSAQKMQFLKGKIRGEAERLIHHLHISSENYNVCWDILNRRFNNKKLIFASHMNILLALPNINQQSLLLIKKMHDVTTECLNSIKNLGVDISTWDLILVHLLSQKLDSITYGEYIESLKAPKDLPVLSEFLSYLEVKFTTLESSRRKQEIQVPRNPTSQQIRSNNPIPYYSNNNSYKYVSQQIPKKYHNTHATSAKCPLCKNIHALYNCYKFKEMSNEIKLKTVRNLHLCHNCLFDHNGNKCTSTKKCQICAFSHHTLLHDACIKAKRSSNNHNNNSTNENTNPYRQSELGNRSSHISQENLSEILLATAQVKVTDVHGSQQLMRALIDQGSQISLITENAAQRLGLKREKCSGVVFGVGHRENNCKGLMKIVCSSVYNNFSFNAEVLIMNHLIKNLPNKSFAKPDWSHLENIKLADPKFYNSQPVDLLLGAEIYSIIMMGGIVKGETLTQPIAQQTHLGWLLSGSIKTYQCNVIVNNLEDIKQFWEVEDISEQACGTSEKDQQLIEYYNNTTKRDESGRYEVRLPLREDIDSKLGSSKQIAISQFKSLENKFRKQPVLAKEYKDFFQNYIQLQHMKPVVEYITPDVFLPHHCVQRQDSTTTKYRAVFNASIKTSSGLSLNDLMHKGPNLQQDLQLLILRWRKYKYGFTADIEKMYRQIKLSEEQQRYQKVVWRDSEELPLKCYQLTTVTYGTKAAPFLAMMTLKRLATDERYNYPEAAQVLEESFFMDDLVHGSSDLEQGQRLIEQLRLLLMSGGFNLRKWSTNEPKILEKINGNEQQDIFNFKEKSTAKILGLGWCPKTDKFIISCNLNTTTSKLTKREILSEISKLFDPLGWLTPITTKLKILFQKVCNLNIQWDDVISDELVSEWKKLRADMNSISSFETPRWIGCSDDDLIQLHGFCDASQNAYACVIYSRLKRSGLITLIAAKSKLVPSNKVLTIPQLELCAAHLLSKLMIKVEKSLSHHMLELYGWSDSKVVLAWLQSDPGRYKIFVANRVRNIIEVMPASIWRYVKSTENPADSASRGIMPSQVQNNSLWWQGPPFLATFKSENESSSQIYITDEQQRKIKQTNVLTKQREDDVSIISSLLSKYSSFFRVVRVLAWIKRFIGKCQTKQKFLSLKELSEAQIIIIKHTQSKVYREEIKYLNQHKDLPCRSQISNLHPYCDDHGILRVGGRLNHANIPPDMKNPIIIPRDSRLAQLLIWHAHKLTFHGGARVTAAFIRQKYWLVGGNRAIKSQLRKCVTCRKQEQNKSHQLMGDLPASRSNPSRPFCHTGIDYTGHVFIKANKGRGIKTTKGYVAVFVCMVTKAVHLELVSDLSSSGFLAALKRMASRKGVPSHMYSDQGTNFIKSNRILQQQFKELIESDNEFMTEMTEMGIKWHFNAPSWPSAGGLWEAAVKSLKHHMKRVIGEQRLTFEEFSTLLAQLEAVLNSRPLCPLTEDPDDLNFLTPAHFLTGGSTLILYETECDLRTRWHLTQKIFRDIWKRWQGEYLAQLNSRSKWRSAQPNIKIDDMVVVHDANLPAGKWALGRVIEVHPGSDGYVRVVTLKTKNGILKRPIVKLSILPVHPDGSEQPREANEDGNVREISKTYNKERKKRTGRIKYCLATTVTSILLFFMTFFTLSEGKYNVTTLPTNHSLYYDKITDINLIRENWKLVVYYDLTPYWEGSRAFAKSLEYLDNICLTIKEYSHCKGLMLQLHYGETELQYYNDIILNQHFNRHSRQKRGLINGIGYLANSLFGILDNQFAEKYEQDIELVRTNQNHLAELWKNQTSIVEAQFNFLKRIESLMLKEHKEIHQKIMKIETALNIVQTEIQNVSISNDFTMTALISTNILSHLKNMQDTILDTITNIYNGKYNPHLLTPNQLRDELNKISGKLPKDVSLPVDTDDLSKIYNLLSIHGSISKGFMIFEIKIPLVSRYTYEVFKIISVPKVSNGYTNMIQPISEYVAINLKKDSIIRVNEHDISTCLHFNLETLLCNLKQPIYNIKDDESMCTRKASSRVCNTIKTQCENKWEELHTPNNYFYFCCEVCPIKIICDEYLTLEQLHGAGLLVLSDGCLIKSKEFVVYSHRQETSRLYTKPNTLSIDIAPINHVLNIELNATQVSNSTIENIRRKELFDIQSNIQKQIEIMHQATPLAENFSYHDIHHYVAIYVLAAILIVIGIFCVARRVKRRMAAAAPSNQRETSGNQQSNVICQCNKQLSEPSVVFHRRSSSSDKQCDSEVRPSIHVRKHRDRGTSPVLQSVHIIRDDSI